MVARAHDGGRVPGEAGERRDGLLEGQQRTQVGHARARGSRRRAHAHPPLRRGPLPTLHRAGLIQPQCVSTGLASEATDPRLTEPVRHELVHPAALLGLEPDALPRLDRRVLLRDQAAGEGRQRVRHLVDESTVHAHVPTAAVGRLPPGERDLRAQPTAAVPPGDAPLPLGCGAQRVETGRERRLGSGGGGLELLERANGLEAGGLVLRKVGGGQLPDDVDAVVGAQGPAAQIRCASEARGGWPIRAQRLIQMRDARRIFTGLAQGGGLRPAPRPRPARHRPLIHDPHATKGPGRVERAAQNCGGAVGTVPAPLRMPPHAA